MSTRTIRVLTAACIAVAIASACSAPSSSPPKTVTVTPSATTTTTPQPVATDVTIPDVTGQNAEIVRHQLEDLGLTKVELASTNPEYSMVILARNWTVVGIEPAPGTVVKSDTPVIVKVYKD